MKIFQSITKSALGIFRLLGILLILAILIFIVKWRTNHLFSLINPETKGPNSITEELKDSKDQIKDLANVAKSAGEKNKLITLKSRDSLTIAGQLKAEGLIQDEGLFVEQIKKGGFEPYLKVGTYEFPEGATVDQLIVILTRDNMDEAARNIIVEVPEGVDAMGLSQILQKEGVIQDAATFAAMIQEQNALARIKPGGYNIKVPIKNQDLMNLLAPKEEEQATPAPQALPQESPSPDQAGQ